MKKQKLYSLLLATFLSASAFSVSAHAESLAYKVKSGETLTSIANRYHVSVSQLKTWNHLTSEKIRIGQTITVSVPEATYKVKKGDLITTIAKNHHLLVADIKISNHLTSDRLKVGQTLKIPSHKGVYLTHTVKTGDSLSLISRDYGLSVSNIKKFNNFTTDKVRIGQVLKLTASPVATQSKPPAPKPVSSPVTTPLPSPGKPAEQETIPTATVHTVQSGEYLSLIAKKYQTTVSEIKRLNSLSSDTVFLGQELKITEGSIPAPAFLADGMFPMAKGTYTSFQDTWGNSRQFGGNRVHEGTDIMASKGTRLYAVTDGTVTNYGWNELGGWRVTIRTQEGYYLYYAHLNKYAAGIGFGSKVKKGQLVGYVGNTGYGAVGTSGKFPSHLHFGIYDSSGKALNPYHHLHYWEAK